VRKRSNTFGGGAVHTNGQCGPHSTGEEKVRGGTEWVGVMTSNALTDTSNAPTNTHNTHK